MSKSHGRLHPERYEIVKRKVNSPDVLDADGRKVKLRRQGPTEIRDSGLARDLAQKYGHKGGNGDVLVIPVDNNHLHGENEGHCYTFTCPELPWHRYDKHGNRVK